MMQTTTGVSAPIFENIPERLTERTQWVCWRLEEREPGEMTTVAELFASPPLWLVAQVETYRKDPEHHIESLCSAVAVVVLNDGSRGPDVRGEVEKELERWRP